MILQLLPKQMIPIKAAEQPVQSAGEILLIPERRHTKQLKGQAAEKSRGMILTDMMMITEHIFTPMFLINIEERLKASVCMITITIRGKYDKSS